MSDDKIAVREQQSPVVLELKRVHEELAKWRGKAFLLTPYARTHFDNIKVGYRPEFRVTYISPDVSDQQVYKLDNQPNKLVLSKIGLQLLDHLAGIKWVKVWNAQEPNDPIDKYFCKIGAEGKVQDLDGEYRNAICTMTLDLREGSPQTVKMTKKFDDGRPDTRQLDRARLNIRSQTETLAKNKVRRELLGLQGTYTPDELKGKPFVILKLNPVRDMNDPLIRKLTIMEQFNISSELYDQAVQKVVAVPEEPTVVNVTPEPVNDPAKRAIDEHAALIARVEDLYKKKVRGGRGANKAPLSSLSHSELLKLEELLWPRPDIA